MPHFVVDCSESVLTFVDPEKLMKTIYDCAVSTNLFAESGVGGIKVRLNPYKHFLNVDDHKDFIHIFANIMEGRTQQQKKGLSDKIVRTLKTMLPTVDIISMNIRDFEKATYRNTKQIQDDEK